MVEEIIFKVPGTPRPAGSKRAFVNPKTNKPIIVDQSGQKGKDWRADVKAFAVKAMEDLSATMFPKGMGLSLNVKFYFIRPKCHYRSGKNMASLKDSAPESHTKAPDTTKLIRAIEDSLNKVLWHDDNQVVSQAATKYWSTTFEGALIRVWVSD